MLHIPIMLSLLLGPLVQPLQSSSLTADSEIWLFFGAQLTDVP